MKKLKLVSLCIAATLSSNGYAQTLQEAVNLTLENNPRLKAEFHQTQSLNSLASASESSFLPSINLSSGIGQEHIKTVADESSSETAKQVSITATQLLWDGANTSYDIKRTATEVAASESRYKNTINEMTYDVAKVYLDVLKFEEMTQLSLENLSKHEELHASVKKVTDSGIGSTADLYQASLRLASARNDSLIAKNNLLDAEVRFIRLVGQPPVSLTQPNLNNDFVPFSLDEATQMMSKSNPAITADRLSVDAARFELKQSKSSFYPTWTLDASHTYRDDVAGRVGDSTESSIMVNMRWNLFNGYGDSYRADSAASNVNRAKDLRDENLRAVNEELEMTWNSLNMFVEQSVILISLVDSAEKTTKSYESQYKINKRTLLDLLNAQNELYQAKTNSINSKYAISNAKFKLVKVQSNILEAIGITEK